MVWPYIVAIVFGYLLGSVPAGYVIGKVTRGIDVREYGSKKTGGTNVLRTLGLGAAVAAIVFDIGKGSLSVLLARFISDEPYVQTAAGLAAVAGHVWPLYVGFRGGRGVSAAFGSLLAMNPLASLALIPVALFIVAATRYMSLMSVSMAAIAAAVFLGLAIAGIQPYAYAVFTIIAGALIVVLHRDNIGRLLSGTERKIGQREQVGEPATRQEG
jgi:glycerol-3-phosphate acyltransferase PlsY